MFPQDNKTFSQHLFHSIGICCLVWQIYYTKLQDAYYFESKYYVLTFQMLLDISYCRFKNALCHTHQTELNISNSNLLIKYLYLAVCEISPFVFVFFSEKLSMHFLCTLIFLFKPGIYSLFPFWQHVYIQYSSCLDHSCTIKQLKYRSHTWPTK